MPVEFAIPRDALHPIVDRVKRHAAKRNTIPILANLRVAALADGSIQIAGTDLDIDASASTGAGVAQVRTPGDTTVPAALLVDFLRGADGAIDFSDTGTGRATLRCGRARLSMHSLPSADLPSLPTDNMLYVVELPSRALTAITERIAFAISTEETRYYLCGAFLHAVDGKLRAAATDGHRLSRIDLDVDAPEGWPPIIIPSVTVRAFKTIVEAAGDTVTVQAGERGIRFDTRNGFVLASKLIDGAYPDYQRVIPGNSLHAVSFERARMIAAIERVAAVAATKDSTVRLTFADGDVALAMNSAENGDAEDFVAIEGDQPDFAIGFNAEYLRGILGTFDGPTARMRLTDPGSAALLEDPTDESRVTLLMPMRV